MSNLPSKSFAMVQTGIGELTPKDVPIPDIDDDSALLRLEACGICGSDYEQFDGRLRTPMPVIPGHEPLGVVARVSAPCDRNPVECAGRVPTDAAAIHRHSRVQTSCINRAFFHPAARH